MCLPSCSNKCVLRGDVDDIECIDSDVKHAFDGSVCYYDSYYDDIAPTATHNPMRIYDMWKLSTTNVINESFCMSFCSI